MLVHGCACRYIGTCICLVATEFSRYRKVNVDVIIYHTVYTVYTIKLGTWPKAQYSIGTKSLYKIGPVTQKSPISQENVLPLKRCITCFHIKKRSTRCGVGLVVVEVNPSSLRLS